jgi:hypothetical protein
LAHHFFTVDALEVFEVIWLHLKGGQSLNTKTKQKFNIKSPAPAGQKKLILLKSGTLAFPES